jgi:hypothetical protein
MTFRGPVPLASIPSPLSADRGAGLADNGGAVLAADRSPENHRGPDRESRYLTGLLAVRGLPFDTTYLQARIVAGYRKGGA